MGCVFSQNEFWSQTQSADLGSSNCMLSSSQDLPSIKCEERKFAMIYLAKGLSVKIVNNEVILVAIPFTWIFTYSSECDFKNYNSKCLIISQR